MAISFSFRFSLGEKQLESMESRDWETILSHVTDFINQRLAFAKLKTDGRQKPMKGHPVFVAQHATATCCRGCLAKWHGIASGRELDIHQVAHLLDVMRYWLEGEFEFRIGQDVCV